MNAPKTIKVTVRYWRGTLECKGEATTYAGALRLASKNQNAFGPTFYDQDGRRLHDDGHGLAYDEEENGQRVYAV